MEKFTMIFWMFSIKLESVRHILTQLADIDDTKFVEKSYYHYAFDGNRYSKGCGLCKRNRNYLITAMKSIGTIPVEAIEIDVQREQSFFTI